MAHENKPGELALVKAARTLDQGDVETIPDKLDQILKILEVYPGGNFHAAEEVIVRWLLKNMNGSSADAERLRRYPLTWRILSILFSSIPLFSLAKSLADRRFVNVLQAAVKDLSEAEVQSSSSQDGDSSDTVMADAYPDEAEARPSKRKKLDPVSFDPETQRQLPSCLRAAEALFASLRSLLARLDSKPDGTGRDDPMGAEHIKSLFSSYTNNLKDILAPALAICELAMDYTEFSPYTGQDTWISTISNILDLHIKKDGEVLDVASYLSRASLGMLGRLTGTLRDQQLGLALEVQTRWAKDLRRFLTRSLMLPARTAFVNRGTTEAIEIAVQMAAQSDAVSYPVIFDLVISSPRIIGSQSAKRENEAWVQAVFDIIQESLRFSTSEQRPASLQAMMDMVHGREVVLSLQGLRSVCKANALRPDRTHWTLLLRTAEINPDVFIAEERQELLHEVLDRTRGADSLSDEDLETATLFIITLADGFAKARDLAGFVKKWFQYLAFTEPHLEQTTNRYHIWYNKRLNHTVALSLQKSMNIKQISSLLDWLDSQDGLAEVAALALILAAISKEITQVELIDAIGQRLFEMVFSRDRPASLPMDVSVCIWSVTESSIEWGTLEQAELIWARISPELRGVLEKSPLAEDATLHAFRCSAAAWLASYPGGKHEDEAAATACGFLDRLTNGAVHPAGPELNPAAAPYINYLLVESPQLLSLVVERTGKCPGFLLSALSPVPQGISNNQVVSEFLASENNINNRNIMDNFLGQIIATMEGEKEGWSSPVFRTATEYLLAVPLEAITREQREQIMGLLVDQGPRPDSAVSPDISDVKRTTSLMVKIMRRPTFYPNIKFGHLYELAAYLAKLAGVDGRHEIAVLDDCLPLLKELAILTTRQMTSNIEKREREYLLEAASQPPTWFSGRPYHNRIVRMVLLKTLVSALEQPSALKALPDLDIGSLKQIMSAEVRSSVGHFCSTWERGDQQDWDSHLAPLLATLDSADILDQAAISEAVGPSLPCLVDASEQLSLAGYDSHWDLKILLARLFGKEPEKSSATDGRIPRLQRKRSTLDQNGTGAAAGAFDKAKILEFVDTTIQNADEDTKLEYLRTLLAKLDDAPDTTSQLLSAYRIVQRLEGPHASPAFAGEFSLSTAHTALCKRLRASRTPAEFVLVAQLLHAILEKPGCMTQWNVELTLSTVSALSSQAATHPVVSARPEAFGWLCRLAQAVVRRHRLRLEGHLHLVVAALQSLLRTLLTHPYASSGGDGAAPAPAPARYPHWEGHARLLARLLTLVCEPSAASVQRGGGGGGGGTGGGGRLDSATDAARRSAGGHMYLVLMLYVRLQLERDVPRAVREALEPAAFSVLDITTPEGRRIMNEAMDASGRVVMKEMYKRYLKFGKWSGV